MIEGLSMEEQVVLQLAASGESIADLGEQSRWHGAIGSLVQRGLLRREDQFNHVITEAGRALFGGVEDEDAAARKVIEAHNASVEARKYVEQAAMLLRRAAVISAPVTGHTVDSAIDQWSASAAAYAKGLKD